jgi:hypothetical protein
VDRVDGIVVFGQFNRVQDNLFDSFLMVGVTGSFSNFGFGGGSGHMILLWFPIMTYVGSNVIVVIGLLLSR